MSQASKLAPRMKYLRSTEAMFSLVLIPILAWYWLGSESSVAWSVRVPPLVLVCYILAQGATYWALKYRQYAHGVALPPWLPRLFRVFRLSNVIGLLVVALWLAFAASSGIKQVDLAWGAGLWAFALLEHVNYYHLQLMYDTRGALRRLRQTRRLRTPMLAEDMRRDS